MIDNFAILVLTHFVSDWFLQPREWAVNKTKKFKPRFYHCIQYTILFLPVLYFLQINLLWLIWIFLTHLFIDSYKFVNWWNKKVKMEKETPREILTVQDQILHILVLIPLVI